MRVAGSPLIGSLAGPPSAFHPPFPGILIADQSMKHNFFNASHSPGTLIIDPVISEQIQYDLQKQILQLQQEQQIQQQILLQHYHLQQRQLAEEHEKQLQERIRLYMEHQKLRDNERPPSNETEEAPPDDESEKEKVEVKVETKETKEEVKEVKETSIKCPKKDAIRKLEEEEKEKQLQKQKENEQREKEQMEREKERERLRIETPSASPPMFISSIKRPGGASAEVKLKLQQFVLAKKQREGHNSDSQSPTPATPTPAAVMSQRQSSSSDQSSSHSDAESPPASMISRYREDNNRKSAFDMTMKVRSALRQKVMTGRTSPLFKTSPKHKPIIRMDKSLRDGYRSSLAPEMALPNQQKNMYQMITYLLGHRV